jgi:hypothetical protein
MFDIKGGNINGFAGKGSKNEKEIAKAEWMLGYGSRETSANQNRTRSAPGKASAERGLGCGKNSGYNS